MSRTPIPPATLTEAQTRALLKLRAGGLPTYTNEHGTQTKTGVNTATLHSLQKLGLITGRIWLRGVVTSLKVAPESSLTPE